MASTAVLREAWATLPESSSRPLPATLAQSRNLAHASLETAVARRVAIRVKGGKILERGLNRIYVLVPSEKLQPKNKVINPSRRSKRLEARKKRVKNTALMLFTPKYADS